MKSVITFLIVTSGEIRGNALCPRWQSCLISVTYWYRECVDVSFLMDFSLCECWKLAFDHERLPPKPDSWCLHLHFASHSQEPEGKVYQWSFSGSLIGSNFPLLLLLISVSWQVWVPPPSLLWRVKWLFLQNRCRHNSNLLSLSHYVQFCLINCATKRHFPRHSKLWSISRISSSSSPS